MSGKPLQVKVKQAYQNFYVYGSVEPKTGENFSLFLPWVNTEMMNLYLEQMSQVYENEEIVVIMDQAGWHKAKDLVVPDNIDIIYLPPYSPELNPIERLWKYMKTNYIHNRVFESLKQMMALMVDVFAGLKPVIPTQLIFYPKLLVTKIQSA
jgi:transposase